MITHCEPQIKELVESLGMYHLLRSLLVYLDGLPEEQYILNLKEDIKHALDRYINRYEEEDNE